MILKPFIQQPSVMRIPSLVLAKDSLKSVSNPAMHNKPLGTTKFTANMPLSPSWEDVLAQRLQGLGTLTYKHLGNYLQRHDMFSSNAFIAGAAILCAARIKIANASATEAKYTPQEQQRKREAITTTTREVLGWSLSYGLLRLIQTSVCDLWRGATGLRVVHHEGVTPLSLGAVLSLRPLRTIVKGLRNFTKDAWHLVQGKAVSLTLTPAKGPAHYSLHPEKSWFLKNPNSAFANTLRQWGEKKLGTDVRFKSQALRSHAALLEGVKQVYQVAPAYVGSIPALLLSGIALEWLSLRYGKQIVNLLSKHVEYGNPEDFLPVSGPPRVPSLRLYYPSSSEGKHDKVTADQEFTTSLEVHQPVKTIPLTAETTLNTSLANL